MDVQQPSPVAELKGPIEKAASNAKSGASTTLDPDVKLVLDLLDQGKKSKDAITADWDERWDFVNDKQWRQPRPKNKSDAVFNVIKITLQTKLPILTDAQPGFNVIPEEPSDYEFAELLSKVTESWWDRSCLNQSVVEVLMDSMIYDAGFFKVTWNPELDDGIGNVEVTVIDPRDIYVPEDARDFNKQCPWTIQLMNKTVGELKRKFPEFADQITPDSDQSSSQNKETSINNTSVTIVSPVDQKGNLDNKPPTTIADPRKTCQVAECWIDDEALIEFQEENPDTHVMETKYKKAFPRGKLITILVNKKLKLQAIENPYKHGQKPFVRFVDTILPRKFWGDSEVRPLMSIQKVINKVLANIVDYMNYASNPIWIVSKNSGIDTDRITNSYGLVLKTLDVNSVKRDIPPPIPSYVMDLYNMMVKASEAISGVHDVTQGRKPPGVTAAAAIETLQEASQTRIRLQERNLQGSLSQLGRIVISLMMQYYDKPRVARITGSSQWPEYFDFYVEELPEDKVRYNKRGYTFNKDSKKYVAEPNYTQGQPSKGIFDVKVLSGTSLPFAKTQRSNLALKLFESQAIDQEELLKTLEWPNTEQLLTRLQKQATTPPGAQ